MKYGYARVPTEDQNPVCNWLRCRRPDARGSSSMKASQAPRRSVLPSPGISRRSNPGPPLIVWKLDRLGRNLRDLIALLDALPAQGVKS
jgi:resolvase-like protein